MTSRAELLLLTTIVPAPTGNGLAMRAWCLMEGLAAEHVLHLVVVPVSDPAPELDRLPSYLASKALVSPAHASAGVVGWVSDPLWRDRYRGLEPCYPVILAAPPSLAEPVMRAVGTARPAAVVATRLALAPLAVALAERCAAPLVIDSDDDDVDLHQAQGEHALADAGERVQALCFPRAARVTAASAVDAERMSRRLGLNTIVALPNHVEIPAWGSLRPPPRDGRVVFVGNLGYQPNIDGAHWLVEAVLPLLPPRFHVELVGGPTDRVSGLVSDRVRVSGRVADISRAYSSADVVVAPLWSGSGTRIKALEAFAHGRPLVATTKAIEGLAVVPDTHLLVADDASAFAAAIERAASPEASAAIVGAAYEWVRTRHSAATGRERVAGLICEVLAGR